MTMTTNMRSNSFWKRLAFAAVAGWGAYYLYKNFGSMLSRSQYGEIHGRVPRDIASRVPLAKSLSTIPDVQGNYDIDGVSYDSEGVVIGSDARAGSRSTTTADNLI